MLETCRGHWFSINWMKNASRWFHYTDKWQSFTDKRDFNSMCSIRTRSHTLVYNLEGSDPKRFLKHSQEQQQRYLEIFVIVLLPFLVYLHVTPLYSISRTQFCWSSTPNPPISKIPVKPLTKRKCKIWWCSVVYKERLGEAAIYCNILTFQSPCRPSYTDIFPEIIGEEIH
jgi:hypothetical protein